jgi:uncharacterized membrane protein
MVTMLGFTALVAAAFHLAPQVTRRDIFFGITVTPAFRDSAVARSVSRRYALEIWALAIVAAAFVATSPMPLLSGPMLLAQSIGASVAFARARQAVSPYPAVPATIREATIGPRPGLPGGIVGQLGPFLILCAAAAYVGLHWEDIPAKFATHWNLAGNPNGWTPKSLGGVLRGFLVGFIVCGMMLFTSYAVVHWTRLPRVTGADGTESLRVRRINLIATLASEYLVASLLAWTSVVSMFSEPGAPPRLPLAFRVAPFALVIVGTVTIRVMRRTAAVEGPPIGDTTPDSGWFVGGHLYVNRADPTLFIEKRTGLGYTLNLGNPVSWLVVMVFATALSIPLLLVP